eukprot:TRINITY_DN25920_c0_g2_i4.p1 TRINITY_DN25920_c0_g2~~TRINITY_DN25920_c0_g2_i4.p1  ORF type:complete len:557 (-),score=57.97 TRINITY_DN25920_c0_g2_i4:210-1880(-)
MKMVALTAFAGSPTFVFVVLCLSVQAFMSYDGGATPACVDAIQEDGNWDDAQLGLLGSLDKVGMAIGSIIAGKALQGAPTKPLLLLGLALNVLCVVCFGFIELRTSMYACKVLMGMTQGLQCVFGTCWALLWAPESVKATWLGLGTGAAGLGNGLGMAAAGLGTAYGLSYSFAYALEASALSCLWMVLLLTAGHRLHIRTVGTASASTDNGHSGSLAGCTEATTVAELQRHGELESPEAGDVGKLPVVNPSQPDRREADAAASPAGLSRGSSFSSLPGVVAELTQTVQRALHQPSDGCEVCPPPVRMTTLQQLLYLYRNRVYFWTVLAQAAIFYVVSAIQFLWVRVFVEAYGLHKDEVVLAFLGVTGSGGLCGVLLGPRIIDYVGGFDTASARFASTSATSWMLAVALLGAVVTGIGMQLAGTASVAVSWAGCIMVYAAGNGALPGLLGVSAAAVDPSLRSLATGCTVCMQNCMGYGMGPLITGVAMEFATKAYYSGGQSVRAVHAKEAPGALMCGLAFALAGTLPALLCAVAARRAARQDAERRSLSLETSLSAL